MMSASQIVDMGARLREQALPLYRGDHNAASLFAHGVLMRALRAPPTPPVPLNAAMAPDSAKAVH